MPSLMALASRASTPAASSSGVSAGGTTDERPSSPGTAAEQELREVRQVLGGAHRYGG